MAKNENTIVGFNLFFASLLFFLNPTTSALLETKAYIVYMGARQHDDIELITSTHHHMLATVLGSQEAAADSMIYSYRHGFSGFAAMMTKSQAQTIADLPGVVKVMRNYKYKLQTTRSWDYLGLSFNSANNNNLLHDTKMGDGIIVAVFDSGVTPENEAYNDKGLGPIPSKWKGYCESGQKFNPKKHCNRKLIGARYFINGHLAEIGQQPGNTTGIDDYISPRDSDGHGTHTSSTATASPVHNVSYKGLGLGTLRGGAPRARLAIYKIGWDGGIAAADALKAFDQAIHDGVDVISASFGQPVPLYSEVDPQDSINYGSFHAVAHGISVVASAGNDGPGAQSVSNGEPWVLTVAGSTPDRAFPTPITLGNAQIFMGESLFYGNDTGLVSLIYTEPDTDISQNNSWLAGTVLLYFVGQQDISHEFLRETVKGAGGLGVILFQETYSLLDFYNSDFPLIQVGYEIGTKILLYLRSTSDPKVRLSPTKTHIGKPISTVVGKYSSRGPYTLAPELLKPDIAAPGTNILAAYIPDDPTVPSAYNFLSGTSMATPHVAGIVALLKSVHPDWSPAAIKSAIVTTAWTTDPISGQPIFSEGPTKSKMADAFDYGGGIINPNKARHPGLIYDMGTKDYIHYLCAVGYETSAISKLVGQPISCPRGVSILNMNFPSITIPNLKESVTLKRTVTNVGLTNSIYKVIIEAPKGINVAVKPATLVFGPKVKKISFTVTISTTYRFNTGYSFGSLTWNDGVHNVRIPISVKVAY
ncbi:PREDICTED: subtilisin-like protease SBT3.3 [Ipomoea nil]|uniref:subtilisin-like protease SBT3.3 n=1 Tax=Ipomoea nil TaxID=35883 RepID=UPI000901BFC2|nr:PREDICTED: subtilisin-like protease SBT3.3 [Ipomoea nil]